MLALAFHAVNGLFALLIGAFPTSLDELQHLSFIRSMEARPSLLPRYEDLRVLDDSGRTFTAAPNYLNHPSPYYVAMGWVDRAVGGDIRALRLVDLGLSLAAVALMLLAGFRVLKDWKSRTVFAAALVLFPKAGVVAGLINNDNAALLVTGAAFLALVEWQRSPSTRNAVFLALGLAACGWTKLTILLMLAFGALIAEALRLRVRGPRPTLGACAVVAAGLAVGAIPSLANLAAYGRLLHHTSAFYVAPASRLDLSFGRYALIFFRDMEEKWPALEPSRLPQQLGLCLVVVWAAWALAVGLRRKAGEGDLDAAWRTACGLVLATAPVMAIHLYFGWRTFVEDGFVEMAQMRYYYGVWPGFALGLALLWLSRPERSPRTPAALVTGVLMASASMTYLGLIAVAHGRAMIR